MVKSRKKSDQRITINENDYVITNNEKYEGLLYLESDNGLIGYGDVECLVKTMIARYEVIFDEHMERASKMKPYVGVRYLFGKFSDTGLMNFLTYEVSKHTSIPKKFLRVDSKPLGGFRVQTLMNDDLTITVTDTSKPIIIEGYHYMFEALFHTRCQQFESATNAYVRENRDEAFSICEYVKHVRDIGPAEDAAD